MSPDIYVESRHIGYAILWGLELAVFYDAFLICRNVIKHKIFIVYLEDFFYWLVCAFFVFENLYEIGDGYIRWYMALGVGIGMLFYKLTVSKWLVKSLSLFFNKVKSIVIKLAVFFLKPFYMLWHNTRRLFRYINKRVRMVFRLIKKKLTLALKMLKITLCKR